MEDLIKALTILSKYTKERCPTHCEHDVLMVRVDDPESVSEEDADALSELSFDWDDYYEAFVSYRFGSA